MTTVQHRPTDRARLQLNGVPPGSGGFVLVLPGGGYERHAAHEAGGVTDWLAEQGTAAGHLAYRVQPAVHPGPLNDVLIALAELRSGHHGPVRDPVAVLGFSAGGHLAGLAATATPAECALAAETSGLPPRAFKRPDLLALGYPVVSMVHEPHLGSRRGLLGPREGEHPYATTLSVDHRADAHTPPAFLWHTAEDSSVPASHSMRLASRLIDEGVPVQFHLFPHGGHGLGLAPDGDALVRRWPALLRQWLATHGVGTAG
jgi:acetyl esterase/lipase